MIFSEWIFILVTIGVIFLFIFFLSFYLVYRTRYRLKKINDFVEKINVELMNRGIDKQYSSMETTELIIEYRKLLKDYDAHKKDLEYIADIGCRTKYIENIFVERKVSIPEFNYGKAELF